MSPRPRSATETRRRTTGTRRGAASTQRRAAGAQRGSGGRKKSASTASTSKAHEPRIFAISFASVYPLYVQKAEKKGRTKTEVDEIITWLTGYSSPQLRRAIEAKVDFETFFAQAPRLNPNAALIKGVVCGVRVEEVADPLMRKIRYLDKLIDELAKGKPMTSIFRQ
jgi:hypothetical protein